MTYKDNAVKDLRIAYIGGGSRGWAWTFMRDLALELALGGTIVLYDIDKEAAKANEIIMFQRRKPRPFAGTSEG